MSSSPINAPLDLMAPTALDMCAATRPRTPKEQASVGEPRERRLPALLTRARASLRPLRSADSASDSLTSHSPSPRGTSPTEGGVASAPRGVKRPYSTAEVSATTPGTARVCGPRRSLEQQSMRRGETGTSRFC